MKYFATILCYNIIMYGVLLLALFVLTHRSVSGLKVGDKLNIKFMGCDQLGKLFFFHKALLPPPSTTVHPLKQEQPEEQISTLTSEQSNSPSDAESVNKPVG